MSSTPKKRPAKSSPAPGVYRSPFPAVWNEWTVDQVRAALNDHEIGQFRASAMLAQALGRESRVSSTLDTRVLGALGLPHRMRESEITTNRQAAVRLRDRVDGWWWRTLRSSVLASALRWYILMGFAIGEKITDFVEDECEWRPTGLKFHHPQYLRWDWHRERFMLTVLDGPGGVVGGEIEIDPTDQRWVIFSSSDDRPWMNGVVRSISIPYLLRTLTKRDLARRSEIEGIGIRKATVPKQADPKIVEKFLRDVSALGAETTLKLVEGYGFEVAAVDGTAAEVFAKIIALCDTEITLAILGQNLTTQIEGGSFAAATVHMKVQLDRLESDCAMLSSVCREQIIIPWGQYNIDGFDPAAAPWPEWDPTPPEDKQKKAQTLLTLSQALPTLAQARVDIEPVLTGFDLKLLEPGEPTLVLTPPAAATRAPESPPAAAVAA